MMHLWSAAAAAGSVQCWRMSYCDVQIICCTSRQLQASQTQLAYNPHRTTNCSSHRRSVSHPLPSPIAHHCPTSCLYLLAPVSATLHPSLSRASLHFHPNPSLAMFGSRVGRTVSALSTVLFHALTSPLAHSLATSYLPCTHQSLSLFSSLPPLVSCRAVSLVVSAPSPLCSPLFHAAMPLTTTARWTTGRRA